MSLINHKTMVCSRSEITNMNKDNKTIILADLCQVVESQKIIENKLLKLRALEKNALQGTFPIESLDPLWWLLTAVPLSSPEPHRESTQLLETVNLPMEQFNFNNNLHHSFKDFLFHAIEAKTTTLRQEITLQLGETQELAQKTLTIAAMQQKTSEHCQLKVNNVSSKCQTNHSVQTMDNFLPEVLYYNHQYKEAQELKNLSNNNKPIQWDKHLKTLDATTIECSNKINTTYPPFQSLVCIFLNIIHIFFL